MISHLKDFLFRGYGQNAALNVIGKYYLLNLPQLPEEAALH